MTSAALTYLGGQEVYWINLARSEERRRAWRLTIEPLFCHAVRIEAVDGDLMSEFDACEFVDRWHQAYKAHIAAGGVFMHAPQSSKKFRMATAKSNLAIKRSHLKALQTGLSTSNRDRFMVSEDDITPRSAMWKEKVDPPPIGTDVAIWSGGLAMASVRTDDKIYAGLAPLTWVRVKDTEIFNTLGAGLYEVTRDAANYLIDRVTNNGGPFDHAWGQAFRSLEVWRLQPNAFAQYGPSVRNTANRTPIITREAVRT